MGECYCSECNTAADYDPEEAENQARYAACDYHHGPEIAVCTKCGWTPAVEKETT